MIRPEDKRALLEFNLRKTSVGKYDAKLPVERSIALRSGRKSPNDNNKNGSSSNLETKRAERNETGLISPPEVAQMLVLPSQIKAINVSKIGAKNSLQLDQSKRITFRQ